MSVPGSKSSAGGGWAPEGPATEAAWVTSQAGSVQHGHCDRLGQGGGPGKPSTLPPDTTVFITVALYLTIINAATAPQLMLLLVKLLLTAAAAGSYGTGFGHYCTPPAVQGLHNSPVALCTP